jgi:CRP/FNR family transcriptional regulator, cyclic AMP receptor protein
VSLKRSQSCQPWPRPASLAKNQKIFAQGDSSDAVFYIQRGKVKLNVVSKMGKEATVTLLKEGDFFGEGCLTRQLKRVCTAMP